MRVWLVVAGLTLGLAVGAFFFWSFRKKLLSGLEAEREKNLRDMLDKLKGEFAALSFEALSKNSELFLDMARQRLEAQSSVAENDLEGKKKLIDATLGEIRQEMGRVQEVVRVLEKDREGKFAHLAANLETMTKETVHLHQTAEQLRTALAGGKARGQWGERMAEDVLRLAGFVENINYVKQASQGASRPDYTFFLPQGLKVNMDVKFPLDNYWRFAESNNDLERENYKTQFLRDVKNRIKEVVSRDYIDPEQKTVDYVIVFIPNEQVYAFINEHDRTVLDEALKLKVIFCSPLTLYAVLAVIRQAMDNFALERTAQRMLVVLAAFEKQYREFCASLERMGAKIEDARREYDALMTTRRTQLDRQLKKIAELKADRGTALESSREMEKIAEEEA